MTTKTFSLDREGDAGFLPVVTIKVPAYKLDFQWKDGNWYVRTEQHQDYRQTYYVQYISEALTDTTDETGNYGILSEAGGTLQFWRGHAFVDVEINSVDVAHTTNLIDLGAIITGNALRVIEAFKTKYPAVKNSHVTIFSV